MGRLLRQFRCKHTWELIYAWIFAFPCEYGCAKCEKVAKVYTYDVSAWKLKRTAKGDTFK